MFRDGRRSMNFSFLPTKIKEVLGRGAGKALPFSVSRSGTGMDGKPGETYVVVYEDKISIFSRSLGQNDYAVVTGIFPDDLHSISVSKEGAHARLEFDLAGRKGGLDFSPFEEKNLGVIVEKWKSAATGSAASSSSASGGDSSGESVPSVSGGVLPPIQALAAALMYVAAVDGVVAKEENKYINSLRGIDKNGLKSAYEYYKAHSFDELLETSLSGLEREQELCVLANMLEIGMSDGVLHRSEIVLAKDFARGVGIDDSEYNAVKQVLVIKNKISALLT